jgi:hypothetical protein
MQHKTDDELGISQVALWNQANLTKKLSGEKFEKKTDLGFRTSVFENDSWRIL